MQEHLGCDLLSGLIVCKATAALRRSIFGADERAADLCASAKSEVTSASQALPIIPRHEIMMTTTSVKKFVTFTQSQILRASIVLFHEPQLPLHS